MWLKALILVVTMPWQRAYSWSEMISVIARFQRVGVGEKKRVCQRLFQQLDGQSQGLVEDEERFL